MIMVNTIRQLEIIGGEGLFRKKEWRTRITTLWLYASATLQFASMSVQTHICGEPFFNV